jgi:hypothetical protein
MCKYKKERVLSAQQTKYKKREKREGMRVSNIEFGALDDKILTLQYLPDALELQFSYPVIWNRYHHPQEKV